MNGSGRNAEQRQRERERKKRGARKYGQAKYKHSRMGILSCWCAAGAFLILAAGVLCAFITRGEAPGIVGGVAVISLVLAVFGIRAAIRGFHEREKNYLTCKIGLPVNTVVLILFFAVYIGGLR